MCNCEMCRFPNPQTQKIQVQIQMEIQAYELFKKQYKDPDDEECFFDENEENFTE